MFRRRRPLLLGVPLLAGAALAVTGALTLRGPGLIGAGLAAALAGCTAVGIARESPSPDSGSALESAVWAAGCTAGFVLVVAGVATVAGGAAAVLTVGAGIVALLVVGLIRARRARSALLPASAARGRVLHLPVAALTTRALGEEWLGTTAALAGRLGPAARQALVARREEALDELERRDPEGFARWLAAGPTGRSDPADFVGDGPARRGPVADTDAA